MIDYNRLTRDYKTNPLGRYEQIPEEDLLYLYIELNLSKSEIKEILGKDVSKYLKQYNISKNKEQRNECRRKTNLKKYGCINVSQNKQIKDKKKQTCIEKYGVDNPFKNEQIQEKQKQTCLERYGVENVFNNTSTRDKIKQTCLEKYGTENPLSNKDIQDKIKQTNLEKYGTENPLLNPEIRQKIKETCLQKYGSTHLFGSSYFKQKSKETFNARYGVDNPMYFQDFKDKISSSQINGGNDKGYQTKKLNGSFNISRPEEQCYQDLKSIFKVERQYKSEEYPFACDFYLPDIDLYIECNFHWTHGPERYDSKNIEHQKLLQIWKDKAKDSKFFDNAIYTWTDLDVRKFNIAETCGINYLVFYNKHEFDEWLCYIKGQI